MINIMLVAGSDTEALKKTLEDRGTIEVSHWYTNLHSNEADLKVKMLYPEKLVYVNRSDSPNFLRDMQVLRDLLTSGAFFFPKEILFFTSSAEGETSYCEATMQHVERIAEQRPSVIVPEYTVNISENGNMSFDGIYNVIMGTAEAEDRDVNMDLVFRYEKGNDSSKAFEEEEIPSKPFEPFSYKQLDIYEGFKKAVGRTDSGELIYDEEVKSLPKSDPDFGSLVVNPLTKKISVLFSGNHKAGLSTWSCAFASSLSSIFKKVLIVDLSASQGVIEILSSSNVPFSELDIKQALQGDSIDIEQGISVLRCQMPSLSLHLARNIAANILRFDCDAVVFDVDREKFKTTVRIMESISPKTFIISGDTKADVNMVRELFLGKDRFDLILSNYLNSPSIQVSSVPPDEIRYSIPNVANVYAPIVFKNLALDGYLAESLLGG